MPQPGPTAPVVTRPSPELPGIATALMELQFSIQQDHRRLHEYKDWIDGALRFQIDLMVDRERTVNTILARVRRMERGGRPEYDVFQFPVGSSEEEPLGEQGLSLAQILAVPEVP